ncbi:MAG: isoleucine--tRNA ligase [Candidatus Symbiothrix sp.]|jgi:isoleucyl-tRNA synthetase|nr:isoleucine--tRNA ligase [Candidatus Symbiothrix sp.]
MSRKFAEYNKLDLSEINREILNRWKENDVFHKSMEIRNGAPAFVFYEGPPSANGMPGIHHVIARSIKDIFCRYKTMKGFLVKRKAGWDTHGLPVELGVEKALGITKEDIGKKISVEDYNAACRKEVMKFTKEWEDLTQKMGYWVDMENPYITYDNRYIETLWWLLKELYNKGLLYKGYTIQPYSPAAGTGLSTHELNQPGCYRDVKDTTCTAQFKIVNPLPEMSAFGEAFFLAWTTTPWTLPSNTALCVGPNIEYVAVQSYNPYTGQPLTAVVAKALVHAHFNEKASEIALEDYKQGDKLIPYKIVASWKGDKLAGLEYEQLIPWVAPQGGAFRVITGDFVTTEDGTGIVHIAPTFGADDDRVAKANGVPPLMMTDKDGNSRPMVDLTGKLFLLEDLNEQFVKTSVNLSLYSEYAGRFVKNAYSPAPSNSPQGGGIPEASLDIDICVMLKQQNRVFKIEKHTHNYPHCWRTDKPILYYPLDSWFIRTTAVKDEMIALNNTINWKPQSTGSGRFGKWLENLQDWNLSRSRYWGTPLPIWRTEDGAEEKCIGSVAELIDEINKAVAAGVMKENTQENYAIENIDLHRPYVDNIILVSDSGQPMKRESDLIDVWFDSGAMPFAQFGLPPAPSQGGGVGNNAPSFLTAKPSSYNLLKEFVQANRQNLTQSEQILWQALRGKKLSGYKFRRQHPIDEFIVDFACLSKHLVVEIDGGYHFTEEMQEADVWRTNALNQSGYTVIRFTNEEVIANIEEVLDKIYLKLAQMPFYDTAAKVLPLGEDLGGATHFFPADFIAEGVDQTRGWFFTLHAIATMVFGCVAYKNVVSNGLVLDKNGNKMSKRLGNAVDPFSIIDTFGSDPLRWYMITNASPWDNLKFDTDGIEEARRKFFGTLYNTYSFFALYANVDQFDCNAGNIPPTERPEIDRWILSLLNSLIKEVDEQYAAYEPTRAGRAINDFVNDNLSNWYVRLNRKRFWGGGMSADKLSAYQTLYTCLKTVAQLMAPIAPFYADKLYLDLTFDADLTFGAGSSLRRGREVSVHLSDFPVADESLIDKDLEERMQIAQDISSLVLALRRKVNIKVRQPLASIMVPVMDAHQQEAMQAVQALILNEVNVKTITYVDNAAGVLVKRIKPDFKKLGPRYGKIMKDLAAAIAHLPQAAIVELEQNSRLSIPVAGQTAEITTDDVEIISEDIPGWLVANEGKLTVALDITVTEDLKKEGIARELVNRIQNIRKAKGYEITDRIRVTLQPDEQINPAVKDYQSYIAKQVLANEILLADVTDGTELDLDEFKVWIQVEKQ